MATIFDISLIQSFDIVFPFVFVWAVVFALLQKTEAIAKSAGINAVIATAAGFMILLSQTVIDLINFMIPWFTIAIIFLILMLLLFMVFGGKNIQPEKAIKDKSLQWVLIGIGLVIIFAAFGKVLGQNIGPYLAGGNETEVGAPGSVATGSFEQNIFATLFHPKTLGLIILFAIVIAAIIFLSSG